MFTIFKEDDFSAAHRLREYQGKCEAVHGHNWRVQVFVRAAELDSLGMVVDFTILGKHLKEVLATLDHKDINGVPPFDTVNPSSENIARYIFDLMAARIDDNRCEVCRVKVWETDRSCAEYVKD